MPARLLLIAQAEVALDMGVFPRDEPLSEDGRRSATSLRSKMPRHEVAFAAPSRAASDTASALGLDATAANALRGLDVGTWVGRSLAEIAVSEPQAPAAFLADPNFSGHGGEPISTLVVRIEAWLGEIAGRGRSTVAVAAPAVIRAAFVAALRAPPLSLWHVDVGALTQLRLSTDGRRWAVRELKPYKRVRLAPETAR